MLMEVFTEVINCMLSRLLRFSLDHAALVLLSAAFLLAFVVYASLRHRLMYSRN